MPMQEFLASYAVEVDESGAKRLQEVLQGNKDLAESLAGAFDAARTALSGLQSSLDGVDLKADIEEQLSGQELPVQSIPAELDLTSAEEAAESYTAKLESLRPKLNVNTSGITTAVSSAVSSIRSMMASLSITVPVRAVVSLDPSGIPTGGAGGDGGGGNGSDSAARAGGKGGTAGGKPSLPALGVGGRVQEPTLALIGEERKPEYVIPTDKEDRAVSLMRRLISELSDSAKEKLAADMPEMEGPDVSVPMPVYSGISPLGKDETVIKRGKEDSQAAGVLSQGVPADFSAAISDLMAAARTQFLPAGMPPVVSSNTVEAPVTIQVSSPAAAPEEVGRSVYDLTQRYLLRTLKGVFV